MRPGQTRTRKDEDAREFAKSLSATQIIEALDRYASYNGERFSDAEMEWVIHRLWREGVKLANAGQSDLASKAIEYAFKNRLNAEVVMEAITNGYTNDGIEITPLAKQLLVDQLLINGIRWADQHGISFYSFKSVRFAIAHGADIEKARYDHQPLIPFLLGNYMHFLNKIYLVDILADALRSKGGTIYGVIRDRDDHKDALRYCINKTPPKSEDHKLAIHKLFMASVYAGDAKRVEFYLKTYGLDPNRDDFKFGGGMYPTAMHNAAYMGHTDVMEVLKKYGATLEPRDEFISNVTPLHVAAEYGQTEAVRWLVSNGADVTAVSHGGTAAQIAVGEWGEDANKILNILTLHRFLREENGAAVLLPQGLTGRGPKLLPEATSAMPSAADGDPDIKVADGVTRTAAREPERGGAAGRQ